MEMRAEETKFFALSVGRGKNRTLQIHKRNTISERPDDSDCASLVAFVPSQSLSFSDVVYSLTVLASGVFLV